eukprot:TRINITY_DN27437_c0_g1_i1.p1 TRINITY_DN27437_c0_g1~~TRINITY_DN27437_c0_g1_i1.p1  ORF type:complete len:933 (-),score=174.58 TRINITY_DN27437_c0_g1_i1:96-2894(-)
MWTTTPRVSGKRSHRGGGVFAALGLVLGFSAGRPCYSLLLGSPNLAEEKHRGQVLVDTEAGPIVFVDEELCFPAPAAVQRVELLTNAEKVEDIFLHIWRPPSGAEAALSGLFELIAQVALVGRPHDDGIFSSDVSVSVERGDCIGWAYKRGEKGGIIAFRDTLVDQKQVRFARMAASAWPLEPGSRAGLQNQLPRRYLINIEWEQLYRNASHGCVDQGGLADAESAVAAAELEDAGSDQPALVQAQPAHGALDDVSSAAAADSSAAAPPPPPSESCTALVVDGEEYQVVDLLSELFPWLAANAPTAAEAELSPLLQRVSSSPDIVYNSGGDPDHCFLSVALANFSVSITHALLETGRSLPAELWQTFVSSIPWEDASTMSHWPAFELVAAWTTARGDRETADMTFWGSCNDFSEGLWQSEAMQTTSRALTAALALPSLAEPPAEVVQAAAVVLLGLMKVADWGGLCSALPWGILAALLALLSSESVGERLVTPGYALRAVQAMLHYRVQGSEEHRLSVLAAAPWPVFSLLAALSAAERRRLWPSPLAGLASSSSMMDSSSRNGAPLPFAPVLEATRLGMLRSLQVAHTFLGMLGIPYIAICGTLLGALRHFDTIPWDDDVDLCADSAHEGTLLAIVATFAGLQLNTSGPAGLSWRARRAVHYLESERYVLKANAGRALIFAVWDTVSGAHADLWFCWGLGAPSPVVPGEVAMMSARWGPRLQRSHVVPRRKLMIGQVAVWGPADPEAVLNTYMEHSGWSLEWRRTCRGRKVHGTHGIVKEFDEELPCSDLRGFYTFASPWAPVASPSAFEEILAVLRDLFLKLLPGFAPLGLTQELVQLSQTDYQPEDEGAPTTADRFRITVPIAVGLVAEDDAEPSATCQVLLERGAEWDALDRGALSQGNLILRSFVCYKGDVDSKGGETVLYNWEDNWL